MKLIDLLVKELPHRGGWPKGVDAVEQDCEGELFEKESDYCSGFKLEKCDDWITDVVTKQQYESALAASKAVVGHNGWIQWAGGECPVDSDAIVEVKYRKPNQYQFNNDRAGDFTWSHDDIDGDIIAYRLQKPTKSEQACDDAWRSYAGITEKDDEADLNECIGQDFDVPEWNGEGLPPVGTICEYSLAGRVWSPCKIDLYVGTQGVVISCDVFEGIQYVDFAKYDDFEFRPLRTEAERKRDAFINAVLDDMRTIPCDLSLRDEVAVIYDAIAAGKIPGVKLEEK